MHAVHRSAQISWLKSWLNGWLSGWMNSCVLCVSGYAAVCVTASVFQVAP